MNIDQIQQELQELRLHLKKGENAAKEDEDSFAPSCFGDAVAMQTQWIPMCCGGANFDTHELIMASNCRVEFRALPRTYIFSVTIFITMIIVIIVIASDNIGYTDAWLLLLPIAFLLLCCSYLTRSVFDKSKMLFWKGNTEYDFYIDTHSEKIARLKDVYAVQLIYKILDDIDGEGSDDSYELNIVLNDSRRIHIASYANKDKSRKDASALATFLDKPLWDAIDLQAQ